MTDTDDIRQRLQAALDKLTGLLEAAKAEVRRVRDLRAAVAEALAGLDGKASGLVRLAGDKLTDLLQGETEMSVIDVGTKEEQPPPGSKQ